MKKEIKFLFGIINLVINIITLGKGKKKEEKKDDSKGVKNENR